jgi:hypothetical protein
MAVITVRCNEEPTMGVSLFFYLPYHCAEERTDVSEIEDMSSSMGKTQRRYKKR